MKYLIYKQGHEPFFTKWFEVENNFAEGMVVFDIINCEYTDDGENWKKIGLDQL